MKNFCFTVCIAFVLGIGHVFGSEIGMPQLNPEYWVAQIFWLGLIFVSLYVILWKVFLPKIADSIENRKSRVVSDLNAAQKLKEEAEEKLRSYNKIIEDAKKDAKKIAEESKKKLENDIKSKNQKFNEEIEKELLVVEKEIKDLKKNSVSDIKKIAVEVSSQVINHIVGTELNKSSISAIVDDISQKNTKRYL